MSPHLHVEICSFPGSFEMTETSRGYQNMFSLQKNPEVKNDDFFTSGFFCTGTYFDTPLIISVISKDPGNEQISTSRCGEIFFFLTPNSREDIEF